MAPLALAGFAVLADASEGDVSSSQDADGHAGERVSLNLQDVEVRTVLHLLADLAGLNLVAGEGVTGNMTLHLQDVPWHEVLNLVLAINGLDKRLTGTVLLVAPAEELAERERLQLERLKERAGLAPLTTEFVRIRYADAGALSALLTEDGGAATLSERGRVLVDPRTNSVILTDTADNLTAFKQLVAELDVPVRQVQIEARIVNANSNFSEELGLRFGGAHITKADYQLDLELSALAADGRAEIVARPKVVTADKRPATIESGVEVPFQQATKSGATSIAFKDAVLQLEVTPRITPNDRIVMDLTVKQDTIGRIFHGVPSINTTRISTQVLVDDGQTVVLGGIFQTDRHQTSTRTPLLGDLPLVGRLFQRRLARDDKQELFVFITPSVIAETSESRVAHAGHAG
ncbi:MAG: hypothetical protein F4X98_15795 [Gammaproteobacteria bacterium]|nr:hypothetical protein [Gammaproteobacteria bacterium]